MCWSLLLCQIKLVGQGEKLFLVRVKKFKLPIWMIVMGRKLLISGILSKLHLIFPKLKIISGDFSWKLEIELIVRMGLEAGIMELCFRLFRKGKIKKWSRWHWKFMMKVEISMIRMVNFMVFLIMRKFMMWQVRKSSLFAQFVKSLLSSQVNQVMMLSMIAMMLNSNKFLGKEFMHSLVKSTSPNSCSKRSILLDKWGDFRKYWSFWRII